MNARWATAREAVDECEAHGIYPSIRAMQLWRTGQGTPNGDMALRIHETFFSFDARERELADKLQSLLADIAEAQSR